MGEIKGDYQGRLKTIKATSDAKLETATHIYSSGTWAPARGTMGYSGVKLYGEMGGFVTPLKTASYNALVVAPGIYDDLSYGLSVNTDGELKLATLGTVERVKEIDNIGTVGKSKTYIEQYGTWAQLQGTLHGAYTVPKADRLDVLYNLRCNRDRDLVTAPGWTGTRRVKLLTDDDWRLKLATLGTVEHVNDIDFIGTCMSRLHAKTFVGGVWTNLYQQDDGLMTSPGKYGSNHYPLSLNANHELKTAPATSRKGVVQTVANAGTAIALVASSTPCIGVIVQADYENLGTIYVGDSTVDDTHGFKLRRDKFISFSCQNAGSVYIDASRNAQKVSALYINY